MRDIILTAIEAMQLLTFAYKGSVRTVEPHTYGVDTKGHETLCAWQTHGGSGLGFRDFHVSEMSSLSMADENFAGPRPGYRRGDSTMPRIYAQL